MFPRQFPIYAGKQSDTWQSDLKERVVDVMEVVYFLDKV